MSTTVVLPGPRRIWLEVIKGVVIEATSSSVAVVNQGRDQTQFVGDTAILRPGRISSEVVSIHKVWIRQADGQESAHDLSDFPVDLRPGHSLALVYGAAEGVEEGEFFAAVTGVFPASPGILLSVNVPASSKRIWSNVRTLAARSSWLPGTTP